MTFAKKGTRKVELHNEQFLWRIRKLTYDFQLGTPLGAAIQHGSGGALLMADFGRFESDWYANVGPPITPALIKRCIGLAIERGWTFREKGPQFVLDATELVEA